MKTVLDCVRELVYLSDFHFCNLYIIIIIIAYQSVRIVVAERGPSSRAGKSPRTKQNA